MNTIEEFYKLFLDIYYTSRDVGENSPDTILLVDKLMNNQSSPLIKGTEWWRIADDIIEVNNGIFTKGRTTHGVLLEHFKFIDNEKNKSPIIKELREEIKKDYFDKW